MSERGGISGYDLARYKLYRRGVLGVAHSVSLVRLEGILLDLDGHLSEQEVFAGFDRPVSTQGRELVTSLGYSVLTLAVGRLYKERSLYS